MDRCARTVSDIAGKLSDAGIPEEGQTHITPEDVERMSLPQMVGVAVSMSRKDPERFRTLSGIVADFLRSESEGNPLNVR